MKSIFRRIDRPRAGRGVMAAAAALAAFAAAGGCVCAEEEEQKTYQEQVSETNRTDALQKKYGIIAMRYHSYFEDGSVESTYIYKDSERYIREEEGSVFADKDGDAYGYDADLALPYHMLFAEGAYEAYKETETLTEWETMCGDAALGKLELTDSGPVQEFRENVAGEGEYNGYALAEGDCILTTFFLDSGTKEITGVSTYLLKEDGTEILLAEGETVFDAEHMEPDMEMRNLIFADDARTVTAVLDQGTAQERTYEQTVGKGCVVRLCLGADCSRDAYLDAACTKQYDETADDRMDDLTLYVKTEEAVPGR